MMKYPNKSALFTKAGNVAGFAADGREVCGALHKSGWAVWLGCFDDAASGVQFFAMAADADAHARKLIDAAATERLRWWGPARRAA
jgi:hypothetical protein